MYSFAALCLLCCFSRLGVSSNQLFHPNIVCHFLLRSGFIVLHFGLERFFPLWDRSSFYLVILLLIMSSPVHSPPVPVSGNMISQSADDSLCARTLIAQDCIVSPVCSRTRSQVAKRAMSSQALAPRVLPSSDEICSATSIVSQVSPGTSLITAQVHVNRKQLRTENVNSTVASTTEICSDDISSQIVSSDTALGVEQPFDSHQPLLLPSLELSLCDLSEISSADPFVDLLSTDTVLEDTETPSVGNTSISVVNTDIDNVITPSELASSSIEESSTENPSDECFPLVVDDSLIATVMLHELIDLVTGDLPAIPPSSTSSIKSVACENAISSDPPSPLAQQSELSISAQEVSSPHPEPPRSPPSLEEDLSIKRFVTKNGSFVTVFPLQRPLSLPTASTIRCPFCEVPFSNETDMSLHVHMVHLNPEEESFVEVQTITFLTGLPSPRCGSCHIAFLTVNQLMKHCSSVHNNSGNIFTCEKCNKDFSSANAFAAHDCKFKTILPAIYPFICDSCGVSFETRLFRCKHICQGLPDISELNRQDYCVVNIEDNSAERTFPVNTIPAPRRSFLYDNPDCDGSIPGPLFIPFRQTKIDP
ncbi:hypothetical protein AVEN_217882-1, partial [Araneus ventricosus]